jgi:hypothetical protein
LAHDGLIARLVRAPTPLALLALQDRARSSQIKQKATLNAGLIFAMSEQRPKSLPKAKA